MNYVRLSDKIYGYEKFTQIPCPVDDDSDAS